MFHSECANLPSSPKMDVHIVLLEDKESMHYHSSLASVAHGYRITHKRADKRDTYTHPFAHCSKVDLACLKTHHIQDKALAFLMTVGAH